MRLHATADVHEYAAAVTQFFEAAPCERNVPYTVMHGALQGTTDHWHAPPSFWWVSQDGAVAGAAHWTPPYPLLVTAMPAAAFPLLAKSALRRADRNGIGLRGVIGPEPAAQGCALALAALTGRRVTPAKVMLLQETDAALPVPDAPGRRVAAGQSESDLLGAWLTAFGAEVDEPIGADGPGQVRRMIAAGTLDVWVDAGRPVSLSGYRRPAAGVVRVGPVYTPPEHRNRGYARHLVQEITSSMLARDEVRRCMLFADAANAVSNSIYAQIGYRTTGRHVELRLEDGATRLARSGDDPPR